MLFIGSRFRFMLGCGTVAMGAKLPKSTTWHNNNIYCIKETIATIYTLYTWLRDPAYLRCGPSPVLVSPRRPPQLGLRGAAARSLATIGLSRERPRLRHGAITAECWQYYSVVQSEQWKVIVIKKALDICYLERIVTLTSKLIQIPFKIWW